MGHRDQDALNYHLSNTTGKFGHSSEFLPQCALNSFIGVYGLYERYQKGDFILHLVRYTVFKFNREWFAIAIQSSDY